LLSREVETTKVPVARQYGLSTVAYSPLSEGLLSDKYLSGIQDRARATYSEGLKKEITEEKLRTVRELVGFAKEKGITLPQLAAAWILKKQASLVVTIVPIVGVSNIWSTHGEPAGIGSQPVRGRREERRGNLVEVQIVGQSSRTQVNGPRRPCACLCHSHGALLLLRASVPRSDEGPAPAAHHP